jgi:hypothetical protein
VVSTADKMYKTVATLTASEIAAEFAAVSAVSDRPAIGAFDLTPGTIVRDKSCLFTSLCIVVTKRPKVTEDNYFISP